jgi:lipopolysaccharide/colanic/teichoic acid biosynthesis glycosyltransferase
MAELVARPRQCDFAELRRGVGIGLKLAAAPQGSPRRMWRPSTTRAFDRLACSHLPASPAPAGKVVCSLKVAAAFVEPFVYDRMLHERFSPAERGRSEQPGLLAGATRHDHQREEITFESTRLRLTGLADVAIVRHGSRRWGLAAKRAFDISASLIGLILVAPLLGALSVLICLESPGAPLFRHQRVGLQGRRFGCLKLRTMRRDAEKHLRADSALYDEYRRHDFKIPNDRDPRTTRVGRWLRRASLDELPQLWNVLVGEMSLVGPRPVVDEELEVYGGSRPTLLSMRPGITGAWAVGGRNCVGYPERCDLELRYVRDWGPWMDAKILMATIGAVITPERHQRRLEKARVERRLQATHVEPHLDGPPIEQRLEPALERAPYANSAAPVPTRPLSAP